MKKIKDVNMIILIIILIVFTIGYFTVVNKISYGFENNLNTKLADETKLEIISKCAEAYGKDHKEEFNEEGVIYITVQNLIDKGYLIAGNNGKINSFSENSRELNHKKLRIKLNGDTITADVYS